jgi:hypothetical protein
MALACVKRLKLTKDIARIRVRCCQLRLSGLYGCEKGEVLAADARWMQMSVVSLDRNSVGWGPKVVRLGKACRWIGLSYLGISATNIT